MSYRTFIAMLVGPCLVVAWLLIPALRSDQSIELGDRSIVEATAIPAQLQPDQLVDILGFDEEAAMTGSDPVQTIAQDKQGQEPDSQNSGSESITPVAAAPSRNALPNALRIALQNAPQNAPDGQAPGDNADDPNPAADSDPDGEADAAAGPDVNSLRGTVWRDTNHDGIRDDDEKLLSEITIELYGIGADGQIGTQDDQLLETRETDDDGQYEIAGVVDGNYYIKVPKPGRYRFTKQSAGDDPELDSDVDKEGLTEILSFGADQRQQVIDIGLRRTAIIAGFPIIELSPFIAGGLIPLWLDDDDNDDRRAPLSALSPIIP